MAYWIGTDEAGYGPSLGPLAMTATVWEVDHLATKEARIETLSDYFQIGGERPNRDRRVPLGDSKALYSPNRGLEKLEWGVLACWGALGHQAKSARELLQHIPGGLCPRCVREDWDYPLPSCVDSVSLGQSIAMLRSAFQSGRPRLLAILPRLVHTEEFNIEVEALDGKGAALTSWTLGLVANALQALPPGDRHIVCDKHGGRNRYLPAIISHLGVDMPRVELETRDVSRYSWTDDKGKVMIEFTAKGESSPPVALASMVSKYLRELCMEAFNDYWRHSAPKIAPTRGYPVDAQRFRNEIRSLKPKHAMPESMFWRNR